MMQGDSSRSSGKAADLLSEPLVPFDNTLKN
jgi:hypothetical protein